jgi:hypothetical protein
MPASRLLAVFWEAAAMDDLATLTSLRDAARARFETLDIQVREARATLTRIQREARVAHKDMLKAMDALNERMEARRHV